MALALSFPLVVNACGIIGALLVYGLLQERIMTVSYGGAFFTFSAFLVLLNRLFAVAFGLLMSVVKGESLRNNAPLWKYGVVSLASVGASVCQYESLKYVSFAVQMLGKSFKMMPVMFWGMAISRKVYSSGDWCVAIAVTAGVSAFVLGGPTEASMAGASTSRGLVLLLGFLALDGMTSTVQEKLFKEHATTKFNQMVYVNGISGLVSIAFLFASGELLPAFSFFFSNGAFAVDAFSLSMTAVTSQWFILTQVKEYGALVLAATMNVRQIFSIIVSYIAYGHPMSFVQGFALLIVFGALLSKSVTGLCANVGAGTSESEPLLKNQVDQHKAEKQDV